MSTENVAGVAGLDPTLPCVSFVGSDGKTYYPIFTLGALARIQKAIGRNIVTEGCSFSDPTLFRVLLLESLRRQHPDITEEAVDNITEIRTLRPVVEALAAAFGTSLPAPGEGDQGATTDPPSA